MPNYKKQSFLNTISSLLMQFVVMAIGLILPRLYLKTYGTEVNGLVSSITQFISYLSLVEAGLASAGINALFEPLSKKDTTKMNGVLNATKHFYFQIGYIFSGLVVGLAFLYPLFVSLDGFSYFDIAVLVVVLGLHGSIDYFTLSKYRALLTADQKYYVIANATTIAYLLNFIAVIFAIKFGFSITIVRAVALTMYIVRTLIINIYVKTHYHNIDKTVPADTKALNKRWDAMILQFLGLAQTSMPVILLTFLSNELSSVSVYSVYNLVASSILTLLTALTNGVSATFGDIIASRNVDRLKKWYYTYEFLFLNLCSLVYSVMVIMYIPFIRLYTSGVTDYEYIYPIVAVLFAVNGLLYNIKTPAGILIGAAGVFKETKKGTFIQTAIAIVGCLILTPFWGIPGLLLGLICSNIYRDFDLIIFMSRNVIHGSLANNTKNVVGSIIPFIIAVVFSIVYPLNCTSVFTWIVYAIITTVLCFFIILITNFAFNKRISLDLIKVISNKIKEGRE